MLFRRDIQPSCSYCFYGTDIGRSEIVCPKRGIMSSSGNCGAFEYEPTKRQPEFEHSLNIGSLSLGEDFI